MREHSIRHSAIAPLRSPLSSSVSSSVLERSSARSHSEPQSERLLGANRLTEKIMKLYYIPTTRAVRPRWLLEEMGIPYELVRVDMNMMKQPEYQKLHPHGKVPILVDGEVTIFESTAICAYLADKYLDLGLAPARDTPERGYYHQWLFYAISTLEPPVEHFMFNIIPNLPEKVLPMKVRSAISTQEAVQWFDQVTQPLTEVLISQNYLVEDRLSAADIVTGGVLLWAKKLGMLSDGDPLSRYLNNLMQRPAFIRADEDFYAKIAPFVRP